jgi:hypothetical protein
MFEWTRRREFKQRRRIKLVKKQAPAARASNDLLDRADTINQQSELCRSLRELAFNLLPEPTAGAVGYWYLARHAGFCKHRKRSNY